jgi:hypothetical protein
MFVFAYLIFREDVLESARFIRSLTARDANDAALSLLTLIALVQVSQNALISKRTAFHFPQDACLALATARHDEVWLGN